MLQNKCEVTGLPFLDERAVPSALRPCFHKGSTLFIGKVMRVTRRRTLLDRVLVLTPERLMLMVDVNPPDIKRYVHTSAISKVITTNAKSSEGPVPEVLVKVPSEFDIYLQIKTPGQRDRLVEYIEKIRMVHMQVLPIRNNIHHVPWEGVTPFPAGNEKFPLFPSANLLKGAMHYTPKECHKHLEERRKSGDPKAPKMRGKSPESYLVAKPNFVEAYKSSVMRSGRSEADSERRARPDMASPTRASERSESPSYGVMIDNRPVLDNQEQRREAMLSHVIGPDPDIRVPYLCQRCGLTDLDKFAAGYVVCRGACSGNSPCGLICFNCANKAPPNKLIEAQPIPPISSPSKDIIANVRKDTPDTTAKKRVEMEEVPPEVPEEPEPYQAEQHHGENNAETERIRAELQRERERAEKAEAALALVQQQQQQQQQEAQKRSPQELALVPQHIEDRSLKHRSDSNLGASDAPSSPVWNEPPLETLPRPGESFLAWDTDPPPQPPPTWCYCEQVNPDVTKRKHTYYVYKKRLLQVLNDPQGCWILVSSKRQLKDGGGERIHTSHITKVGEEKASASTLVGLQIAFFIRTVHTKMVFMTPTSLERDIWLRWFTSNYPQTATEQASLTRSYAF